MEFNKFDNYYSSKPISELINELQKLKGDTTNSYWYEGLRKHLLIRELSEEEKKQVDDIIKSGKNTLSEGLGNLVELYNSKTINREEFETLKKELFTSKKFISPKKFEPVSKSIITTVNEEKNEPKNEYNDRNSKSSDNSEKKEQKSFAIVTFFVIILCLFGFIALVNNKSINANNGNSIQISTPSSSTNVNQSTSDGNTCSICGRKFYGLGYEEVSDGVWQQSTSNQYFICSAECGLKHTRKINNLTEQAVQEHGVSNGNVCSNCGLGHYVNGFCSRCGSASKEVVQEHNSRMPICPLCKGTGIEMPMGANTGGETGRICPQCNGTGHISY